MKVLESAENYLEAILIMKHEKNQVRSIDIVNYLGFSKPSISIAMKQLEQNGFITRDANGYICLTEKGSEIAERIYERHVLLSTMFQMMGVSEKNAVSDACKIEHHLSQETFDCIKKYFKKMKPQ